MKKDLIEKWLKYRDEHSEPDKWHKFCALHKDEIDEDTKEHNERKKQWWKEYYQLHKDEIKARRDKEKRRRKI